jgi:hypothetical protein
MGNAACVLRSHSSDHEECVSWVASLCSSGTAPYGFALLIAITILVEKLQLKRPFEGPNLIWEDKNRGNVRGIG